MHLLVSHSTVFNPLGNDVKVAGAEIYGGVTALDREAAFQDKKEIVCVAVGVPDKFFLSL